MNTTNPIEEALITDVRASTLNYLTHDIPIQFYAYTTITVALCIGAIIWIQDLRALILPIAIYVSWITKISYSIEAKFMEQFAAQNGLDYQPAANPSIISGTVLSNGHDRKFTSVISGWLGKLPYQLFLFTTTVGEGRNQTTIRNTVMEIPLGKNVPNIFCVSLKRTSAHWWQTQLMPEPSTTYSLHLEGNFDDYYRIQVDPGEETDALQIFEPDLMAKIIDTPYRYDFELLNQTLFIYASRYISTKAELDSFYKFGRLISRQVYNEISIMSVTDEAAEPHTSQLWPVWQVILNGLSIMSLSVGGVGLLLVALIASTGPVTPAVPALAVTCAVITLIGAGLLLYVQKFKR